MTAFGSIVRYKTDEEGKLDATTRYDAPASFGNFAVNAAMAVNSINAMTGSLDNLIKKSADGKAAFSDWATLLGNTAMSVGVVSNLIGKNNGVFNNGLGKFLGGIFLSG